MSTINKNSKSMKKNKRGFRRFIGSDRKKLTRFLMTSPFIRSRSIRNLKTKFKSCN